MPFLDIPSAGKLCYATLGAEPGPERPLVVLVPGIGDNKDQFRFLAPVLAKALPNARVLSLDPRGQGESDISGWSGDFSAAATGRDLVVLLDQLASESAGAVIVGNSAGAAAAEWAAAERPTVVRGILLLGPFGRHIDVPWYMRALLKALLARPWGAGQWESYYKTLTPAGRRPSDLDEHAAALGRLYKSDNARLRALRASIFASKSDCEARIPEVKCAVSIVMGTKDPDFPDPAVEAKILSGLFPAGAEVIMAEGSGHYPHAETSDAEPVLSAAVGLVKKACPEWKLAA